HPHEASVEDIVQEATELEGRRCELEPAPTELDDRDRGEEPSLPRRIARDVSLVEGRGSLPARGTILEQTLDDGARLVAELASVAGIEDELREGRGHRSVHSRVGSSSGPLRRSPSVLPVTKPRVWTS